MTERAGTPETIHSEGGSTTAIEPARARQEALAGGRTVRCAVLEAGPAADLSALAERPRLEDEGEIARGGMSSIRRAYDPRILRHVAMKVLDGACAAQPGAAQRFLEEAQITGQLDHPNIVPVHDLGLRADGAPEYFTMKLVGGATLSELIRDPSMLGPATLAGGPKAAPPSSRPEAQLFAWRLERLLRIFLKVCDAVAFAHARGVIHRDLKPDNVMVGDHGQVYVMDWGVAMLRQGTRPSESDRAPSAPALNRDPDRRARERPGSIVGTPSYMSPEQAHGRLDEIDERTDVFALGGILYKILTGHAPNRVPGGGDAMDQARAAEVPPPQQVAADHSLPPGLCRIAMRALSRRPGDRQQSVHILQDEVEAFLHGGGWFSTRSFEPGEVIVAEGDVGNVAYIIQSGNCQVRRTAEGGRTVVRSLGPGDVFGETAILTDRPRNASVVALTSVTALVVTRESLEHELEQCSWLAVIMRALAERYRELDASASP